MLIINLLYAFFIGTLVIGTLVGLSCPEYCCDGAVQIQVGDQAFKGELPIILRAANRNKCYGDDLLILLAIRKAENGRPGREFGILHPKCLQQIKERPGDSLDIQAGWAAATIVKNRERWRDGYSDYLDFITFLGNGYCPASADPQGNKNWRANVRYWFDKYRGAK